MYANRNLSALLAFFGGHRVHGQVRRDATQAVKADKRACEM